MAGNINEFKTPELGLTPSETGISATETAARRIGAFYSQAGQDYAQMGGQLGSAVATAGQVAVDYMDHQQINDGAAKGAQLMANLNQKWEDTLKQVNLNDPDAQQKLPGIKQKFLDEQVAPALEQFQGGFTTDKSQSFAEQFVERQRNHMFEKTAGDVSSLAGEAVKVNAAKTVNGLASAVEIDPSTHSIDNALWTVDHALGAMVDSSPNIDAVKGAAIKGQVTQEAKENIVKSAVISMITKNPNVDLGAIEQKYGDYLKPGEMKTFENAAKAQAKQNALVDKQTLATNKQIAEQNVRAATNKTILDNVTFDSQTGKPIINPNIYKQALDNVRNNPDAPNAGEAFRTIASWGESQQAKGEKPVDDPVTQSDLMTRMFSADHPTTVLDLMKARADGKISDHTFQAYHGLVQEMEQSPLKGPVWENTVGAVKGELILSGVGLPGKDIPGESNFAKWSQTFIPQYLAKSRTGTLPPNALDVKDPTSMISQSMAPFKRTVAQRAQDYLATLGGTAAAPRNDAMPAIPAPEQRNAGSIYETPRGKMKWTGTGWVAP